jgi:hypothetical protein
MSFWTAKESPFAEALISGADAQPEIINNIEIMKVKK